MENVLFFQVSPSNLWRTAMFPCIKPTWNECRDFSPLCMTSGRIYLVTSSRSNDDPVQHLLLFELCSFQILGNAGLCLQQEFYTVEGLAQELAGSAFVSLDHVPDHRLRLMIHILCLFS